MKFQDATFGAIKNSGNRILIGSLTGSWPDMTDSDHIGDWLKVWDIITIKWKFDVVSLSINELDQF